jgi:hypothetical protein
MAINRYDNFKINGILQQVPFIKIRQNTSDKEEVYVNGKTRMDLLSHKYYNDAKYGWLILAANPEFGSLEFNIIDGSILRIPYPIDVVISQYNTDTQNYITHYGLINK